MRKPPAAGKADAPDPPGDHALERARQFALSRGLPPPTLQPTAPRKRKAAAKTPHAKKAPTKTK